MIDFQSELVAASEHLAAIDRTLAQLSEYRDRTTAEIAKALRAAGAKVNLEAVRATAARPYTLLPINEHE